MSRIHDLIKEMCPNGVRFEALGTLLERSGNVRWSEVPGEAFQYIDLTSVDRITHAICETETITSDNAPSRAQQIVREGDVLFGTTRPMLKRYCIIPAAFDGQIASTGYCVLRPKTDRLLTNFLFHLIGTAEFYKFIDANQHGASYPAISDGVVKEFRIPVPPLEVQHEIVRVLDAFQSLEAELEAELEARRLQYAHYRDSLLSFHGGVVRELLLGEVVSNLDSQRRPVTRSNRQNGEYPYYGANGVQDYVDGYIFDGTFLLIGEDGSVVQKDGSPVINWAVGKIWVNNHAHVLVAKSDDIDLRYLFYYLQTVDITPYTTGGTQPKLNQGNMNRIPILVPPIGEQKRIVAILDKFDALVNDLSIGLPAELNARRKQYEYYRDRLLTFKEVEM